MTLYPMFMLSKLREFLDEKKKTSQLVTYVRLWLYWHNQWNYFDISFKIDSLSLAPRTGREVVEWYVRSFNIDKSQLFLSRRKIN